ncbi:putative spermidine/putrescine transport system substrate-binding protein [Humibacillus xanthopallidus]|uniref:Putative spermidine/putrescine transport system substrate-binding protein n=1 Tax=Humibacillus xanthopallidus TaxID=412689 RepID=A0A543PXA4_9MICO|nr:ABC transporter substrate-binding protein [Humibacillus xanthopallidus]TQN48713.1 putative spermidine/putrescine transport system substrate-binding protein [Humibacillus xanthopallidus]
MSRTLTRAGTVAAVGLTAIALAACSAPKNDSSGGSAGASGGSSASAATATSAADLGGMAALEAAAKKEGALNVIALPPDWANYGQILKDFAAKYPEIKITSSQPDAGSADEIAAAQRLKGQSGAPDVFDLGPAVALANTSMFAPYKVADFDKIPSDFKEPSGQWVNDYGGLMTVGYDSAKVPAPTSLADLMKPEYKGKVALNGDPIKAGAAFAGVQMVSIAEGGSPEDPTKGIEWFAKLKAAGNFLPVDPTPATIQSGQTPVVFDWSYNQVGVTPKLSTWKMWTPPNANLMTYYVQAINKDAPHPAAARLWEEYLYSAGGQNAWLKGGAKPVLFDEMDKAGTLDKTAASALPPVTTPVIPTSDQTDKAKAILAKEWANAIG